MPKPDNIPCAPPGGDWEEVHGRTDVQFPQLEMVRPDLDGIPDLSLPDGYTLRHYQPGDEKAWGEIMSEAFSPYWSMVRFNKLLRPHFGFKPERVIFTLHQGRIVGSAAAFQWPGVPRHRGYIHMVGVKKEHCGHRLGYWLTAACLWRFREEGFREAMLQTEDFRIPAIKHYLRLGFRPALVQEDHREKWTRVLTRIGGPELAEQYGIAGMKPMSRLTFWWRTTLVMNYLNWLSLKGDLPLRSP